ncbi:hypothetical protein GCM10020218_055120 [Dactylosporangium vinaceum]
MVTPLTAGPRLGFAAPEADGVGLGAPYAAAAIPSAATAGTTTTNTDAPIAPPTRCSMRDSVADTPEKPATARPESDHAHRPVTPPPDTPGGLPCVCDGPSPH